MPSTPLKAAFLACIVAVTAAPARADVPGAREAIGRGDCATAGELVNAGLARNDPEAFFLAGFLYDRTRCVDSDPARAAGLYRRAIVLGNVEASVSLGLLTGLGRGVQQDYAEAHRLFAASGPSSCDATATSDERVALGYGETMARLAARRVDYPTSANNAGIEASIDAVVASGTIAGTGDLTFANVRVDPEIGSRMPRTHDFLDPVEAAYRGVMAEAPRPTGAAAAIRTTTTWRFAMRRNVDNRKIPLEGHVALGDTCPVR